jgi:hypothetical protein
MRPLPAIAISTPFAFSAMTSGTAGLSWVRVGFLEPLLSLGLIGGHRCKSGQIVREQRTVRLRLSKNRRRSAAPPNIAEQSKRHRITKTEP